MVMTRAFNSLSCSVLVLCKKPFRISKIYNSQKTFHDPVDSFLGYHDDVPYCKHCKYEFAIGNSSKRRYSARRHVRAPASNGEIILAEQLPETQPEHICGKRFAYHTLFDAIAPADDVEEPIQYEERKYAGKISCPEILFAIFCIKFALSENVMAALLELLKPNLDFSGVRSIDKIFGSVDNVNQKQKKKKDKDNGSKEKHQSADISNQKQKEKKTARTRMKTIKDLNLSIFAVLKFGLEFKLYRQTVRTVFKVCIFVDLYFGLFYAAFCNSGEKIKISAVCLTKRRGNFFTIKRPLNSLFGRPI